MILLFFILVRNIAYAATITVASDLTPFHEQFLLFFYLIQIFAAPLQASYSDHSCRRKSLAFAFIALTLAHLALFASIKFGILFFTLSLFLNGVFGNIIPISIAGLLDINFAGDGKKVMIFSMMTLAIAWLITPFGTAYFGIYPFFWGTTSIAFVCIFLALFAFKDKRDKDPNVKKFDLRRDLAGIRSILTKRWVFLLIKGYLFTEIIYYTLFYFDVTKLDTKQMLIVVSSYAIGYILGNLLNLFRNNTLFKDIQYGLSVSIFSILSMMLLSFFTFTSSIYVLCGISFLFSFGYGIMDPSIYTLVGKGQPAHTSGTCIWYCRFN